MESGTLVAPVRGGRISWFLGPSRKSSRKKRGGDTSFPDKVACQLFVLSVESDTGQRTLNLLGIKHSYRNGNRFYL